MSIAHSGKLYCSEPAGNSPVEAIVINSLLGSVMISRRWQAWINYLLGIWLFISPWAIGYLSSSSTASWNACVLGVAIVVFAAIGVLLPKVWEEVINIILGVWMVVSAWVLGFGSVRSAESNAVIVGLLVIIFATWALMLNRQTVGHRQKAAQP